MSAPSVLKKMKAIKFLLSVLMIVVAVFSLTCFLYPTISNIINEYYNESKINSYNTNVNSTSDREIQLQLQESERYNAALATEFFQEGHTDYQTVLNRYFQILNIDNGIMGYIEIPSIHVRLPIYHGESEDVLKKGAAHMEKTSFPVGGINTHACISAHSGYPSQKFFDDIDELGKGDLIYIKILNQDYIYKIYNTEIIKPAETDKLKIIKGRELLTLITCYPYGINSHRLLVHSERIHNTEDATAVETPQIHIDQSKSLTVPLVCAAVVCTAILSVLGVKIYLKKKRKKQAS